MTFVSAIIVVGLYFNRKRAIATGIAMSGSGLGTFAYAYLTNYLIMTYDWRGTILILSGILLNGVVCGLLFRPLLPSKLNGSRSESVSHNANEILDIAEIKTLLPNLEPKINYLRAAELPTRLSMSTDIMRVQKDFTMESSIAKQFSSQSDCRKREFQTMSNQMSKKDIFYSGSLTHLSHHKGSQSLLPHAVKFKTCVEQTGLDEEKSLFAACLVTFRSNLMLFKDKVFVLLLLTNVCWTGKTKLLLSVESLLLFPFILCYHDVIKSLHVSDNLFLISITIKINIYTYIFTINV